MVDSDNAKEITNGWKEQADYSSIKKSKIPDKFNAKTSWLSGFSAFAKGR